MQSIDSFLSAKAKPYFKENGKETLWFSGFIIFYVSLSFYVNGGNIAIFHLLIATALIIVRALMGKEFLKDWFPVISFFMMYDLLRSLADDNRYIYVREPYEAEKLFFGVFFGGNIPAFWLDRYQNPFVTAIAAFLYSLHLIMPIILGYLLWKYEEDKKKFFEFTWTLALTSYLALITFWLIPAAPPWWVWSHGFTQPSGTIVVQESAAGLAKIDKILGFNLFSTVYGALNANPFAAVPSLHAAYSFLFAFFAIRNYGKKAIPAIIYPTGIYFSAMYLKHHYVIDLLLGTIYALISTYIVTRFVYKPIPPMTDGEEIEISKLHEKKYPVMDHVSSPGHNR